MNKPSNCAPEPYMHSLLRQGFESTVVLVVGGRGGIGAEVVKLCAELGARVAVASRSGESVTDLPVDAGFKVDIGEPASICALAEAIDNRYGRLDILVSTAGSSVQLPLKAVERLEDKLLQQVLTENALAPMVLMREMTPLLKKGNDPVIVNLSSIAAQTGGGSNIAYAASKAALDTASKGFAKAVAPEIRVVNISPSALETGFAKGRGDDFIDNTIAASALQRLASTREVAVAVLCAARLLTATTGTTIVTDAGRHL